MESAQGEPENTSVSSLKKWGPLGLIVAVAIVVIIIVASGGGDGDNSASEPSSSASSNSSQSTSTDTSEEESAEETAEEEATEDSEVVESEEVTPATEECPTAGDARDDLLTGVMFYEEAVTRCIVDDIDWGERCDEETGQLKLPTSNPPA
ncbi:MAG: hypothetical protein VX353_06425, partial [Actinomycetota bacterium]